MFGIKLIRRRSVVITWLVSYLTVLLLPIVVSFFVYTVSSRTLKSEIHQANGALLSQVREVMDSYFQAMQRLNFELTWNVNVQDLLYSNKYLAHPEEYNFDAYHISQDMKSYQSAYTLVDMFYIYLKSSNTVVLPSLVRGSDYTYSLLHGAGGLTFEQWLGVVNQQGFRGFIPLNRIDDEGKIRKTVALVSPNTLERNGSEATNVIMVDQRRILGAIENMELFSKGHVFILDNQDRLLVSNTDDTAAAARIPYDKLKSDSGLEYTSVQSRSYEVQYLTSESGLKFVSMIPSSLYWEKAELVRNLTIATSLVSLLGGIVLTTFFLRRNYNPVRRLVKAFSGNAEIGIKAEGNEFQYLQQALHSTLLKMDTLQVQMERQNNMLRNHFLIRLLKGRLDDKIPAAESLAAFDIRFSTDRFAVILLYSESVEAFYRRIEGTSPAQKRQLLQFIITNVAEEIAGQRNDGYAVEIDEALACLICFREPQEDERQAELKRIARETQRFLADYYDIHLTLSISSVQSEIEGIPNAYQEALDAMEYKWVMGSKEILCYEELLGFSVEESDVGYYYPLQIEQQLINYLKTGNSVKARHTLEEIIRYNFNRPAVSVEFARCLMLNMVSTMIKAVSEIGSIQDSFLVRNPKRIKQLTECETIQEMQMQMMEFLQAVCEYADLQRQSHLQSSRKMALNERIEQVLALIKERYHDPNLNISTIGLHFDMKPSYLSKLFKDQTGEGLLDFINKTRIEQAKHLIAELHGTVSDASLQVGFNDVNAFIRTFKKYEGITPGKFKETVTDTKRKSYMG